MTILTEAEVRRIAKTERTHLERLKQAGCIYLPSDEKCNVAETCVAAMIEVKRLSNALETTEKNLEECGWLGEYESHKP